MFVMIWLAKDNDDWKDSFSLHGQRGDYYNLLVDGFQAGQLNLKTDVHPDLLSPDPAVRQRAPYLLDAGLFEGRYYLYYGVVPAAILLLPYAHFTGHDLSLSLATLVFTLTGFAISLLWYSHMRRRFFVHATGLIDHVAVLLLAFGPATGFLIRRSSFYELPLAAGYAFLAAFIYAISRALDQGRRRTLWLGVASTCAGFAAGCHPNYALLCLLVALTAWWIFRDERLPGTTNRPTFLRLTAAAVLPAAVLGSALAVYNYARFGDPLEFGFKYGLNVFFTTNDRLLSLDFIWPNLKWYYLTPPTLLPYFPFFFPADATFRPEGYHGAEAIHGQFLVFIALAWIAVGLFSRRTPFPLPLRRLAWVLAAAFAISAGFIFLFGIRANRYMVDFQLPLVALGIIGALHVDGTAQRERKAWRGSLLVLVIAASIGNVLAAVQQFDDFRYRRPAEFDFLSRKLNPSWELWDRLGLVKTGTLVLDVTFKAQERPVGEPLITVGIPGYSDCVYAIQHPGNHLEFLIDHLGYGGPKSRLFSYEPGKPYRIEIELGSFYPPATDPYFAGGTSGAANKIKTTARILFDGQTAINQSMALHEAAPWQRDIGTNLISRTLFSTAFSGQILTQAWIPPQTPLGDVARAMQSATMRLSINLPENMPLLSQPLAGFGLPSAGTLLYLRPESPGKWTLMVDEWGHPSQPGIPVEIGPGHHTIDLFVGPLLSFDPAAAATDIDGRLEARRNRIIVWVDGQPAAQFSLAHHLEAFANVVPGANIQGFSTADTYFYASFGSVELSPDERTHILRAAAETP